MVVGNAILRRWKCPLGWMRTGARHMADRSAPRDRPGTRTSDGGTEVGWHGRSGRGRLGQAGLAGATRGERRERERTTVRGIPQRSTKRSTIMEQPGRQLSLLAALESPSLSPKRKRPWEADRHARPFFPYFMVPPSRHYSYRDRIRCYPLVPSDRDFIMLDAGPSGEPDQDIRQRHLAFACDRRRPLAAHVEHTAASDNLEILAVRNALAA